MQVFKFFLVLRFLMLQDIYDLFPVRVFPFSLLLRVLCLDYPVRWAFFLVADLST